MLLKIVGTTFMTPVALSTRTPSHLEYSAATLHSYKEASLHLIGKTTMIPTFHTLMVIGYP